MMSGLSSKPASKSAPSSPPITTVTAASPEPPPPLPTPLLTTLIDTSLRGSSVSRKQSVECASVEEVVVTNQVQLVASSTGSLEATLHQATGSDSLLTTSNVSGVTSLTSSTTALQRLNKSNSNTTTSSSTANNNNGSQEQSSGVTAFNRYTISSAASTPDHPATLSPTSPISQRLAVISQPSGQYFSQLGSHRSSMQYIQTPGTGSGSGSGGGVSGSAVFTSRRRGSSNAGQSNNTNNNSNDRGNVSSSTTSVGGGGTIRRKSREFVPGPIRRASQVLISLTSPDGASLYGECSRRDSRAVPQITLMSSTFQRLPMKDFGAEVRASMDVDQFLQQAVLLLDVNETSLEGIVDRIVKKVSKLYILVYSSHLISCLIFFFVSFFLSVSLHDIHSILHLQFILLFALQGLLFALTLTFMRIYLAFAFSLFLCLFFLAMFCCIFSFFSFMCVQVPQLHFSVSLFTFSFSLIYSFTS